MLVAPLFFLSLCVAFVDLLILLRISSGLGILFIVITQLVSGGYGIFRLRKLDFTLFFFLDAEMKKGEPIIREIWEEAWVLTAACMLVLPGLISDLVGVLGLVPLIRRLLLDYLLID